MHFGKNKKYLIVSLAIFSSCGLSTSPVGQCKYKKTDSGTVAFPFSTPTLSPFSMLAPPVSTGRSQTP